MKEDERNVANELASVSYIAHAGVHAECASMAYGSVSTGNVLTPGRNLSLQSEYATEIERKLQGLQFPTTQSAQEKCWYYYGRDDLVGGLIDFKTELASASFALKASSSKKGQNVESLDDELKRLQEIEKYYRFQDVVECTSRDLFLFDCAILYWNTSRNLQSIEGNEIANEASSVADEIASHIQRLSLSEGEIASIKTLDTAASTDSSYYSSQDENRGSDYGAAGRLASLHYVCNLLPHHCDYNNYYGRDTLIVQVPKELVQYIRLALGRVIYGTKQEKAAAVQALTAEGIPYKYILMAIDGKTRCKLNRKDGDNWHVIMTPGGVMTDMPRPKLSKIAWEIETRINLKTGDFAAGVMCKNLIQHITLGESITQGSMAGLRTNWATNSDCQEMLKIFSTVDKCSRISTNHTVNVNWIMPPKEAFDVERYTCCESAIHACIGVTRALYSGDGGAKYNTAFLGNKRLAISIRAAQGKINRLVEAVFSTKEIREELGVDDNISIYCGFDYNALKDPVATLRELEFLWKNNIGDPDTTLRELSRDASSYADSRRRSLNSEAWKDLQASETKTSMPGRKPRDGDLSSEGTRTRSPNTDTTQGEP